MHTVKPRPSTHEIRHLFLVIFLGIFSAVLFTAFLLYIYNPSGNYVAGHVLIAPDLLEESSYQSSSSFKEKPVRFSFAPIEYRYFNLSSQKWDSAIVSLEHYAYFYYHIENEQSLPSESNDLFALFQQGHPASLTIQAVSENGAQQRFQLVEFSENGNYYRVHLNDIAGRTWAYYFHPGIYAETNDWFTHKVIND